MRAGPGFGVGVLVRVVLLLRVFGRVAVLIGMHVWMSVTELGLHVVSVALVQVVAPEKLILHRRARLCGMGMLEGGIEVERSLGWEECICAESV